MTYSHECIFLSFPALHIFIVLKKKSSSQKNSMINTIWKEDHWSPLNLIYEKRTNPKTFPCFRFCLFNHCLRMSKKYE